MSIHQPFVLKNMKHTCRMNNKGLNCIASAVVSKKSGSHPLICHTVKTDPED